MSDYTNTLSGTTDASPILGTSYQTEFAAIKVAVLSKGNKTLTRNSDGSSIDYSNAWSGDVATSVTAGFGETITTLSPIAVSSADEDLDIDAALGNVFVVNVTWSGNHSLLLNNPTNSIDGQEIFLVVIQKGSFSPDVAVLDNGTEIIVASNIYKSLSFTTTVGGTADRANLYRLLRVGGVWLCWCEQNQVVMV